MSSRTLLHLAGRVILLILLMVAGQPGPTAEAAAPGDELSDLTGRASAIATLKVRDNFANQLEYDVTVRNLTSDPLKADSLVVVVEGITDLAGKDARTGSRSSALTGTPRRGSRTSAYRSRERHCPRMEKVRQPESSCEIRTTQFCSHHHSRCAGCAASRPASRSPSRHSLIC